ncbi:MAG: SRPBCC family protein [Omnitrophica WOR_2 bacterium]
MTDNSLTTRVSILIHAPASEVWEALTNPDLIQQYLFGTRVATDWKAGSPITWRGEWQGKEYEDKGTVLQAVPERLIETTYWSSMGGLPDAPENYKKVTYELKPEDGDTLLTLTQDNNASEEEKNHTEQNWKMVLDGLKKLVER